MSRRLLNTVRIKEKLNVEELNKLGLGVEIQDFTEPNLTKEEVESTVEKYKEKFKDFNGIKSLHGPFLDLKPASPDKLIREVSYNRYLETIKIGQSLEMDCIIFHSQINPKLNQPKIEELNNKQNREMWLSLLEETNYQGLILIENIFEESPYMLKNLIETINIDNIRINLDIGHVRLGKVPLEDWIRELKDYIVYMHIHSNDGLYDLHLAPSREEVKELYGLLDKYKINPVLSLEYEIEDLKREIEKYRISATD